MSMKTIIKEAVAKNALGFEAAVKEELGHRIGAMIEAKRQKMGCYPEEETPDVVKD